MKRKITIFSVLMFLLPILIYGQEFAPVSEAFQKYAEKVKSGELRKTVVSDHSVGYIPPPVEFKSSLPKNLKKVTELPSSYDPTKLNTVLTSVKNQGGCGDCWAFGTIGSVEATWKKLGYGTYDLSENNLNNKHGFMGEPCAGGNAGMSTAYFTRGSGPVLESQDPNGGEVKPSPEGFIPPAALIDRAYNLPDVNSVSDAAALCTFIKQFIYENGPVSTCIFQSDEYYKANMCTYYCKVKEINHLVLIVGWNDNIQTDGGTGAWIVKNSWGMQWGARGYYFVSYNDKSILQGVNYWPSRMEYTGGEKLYMYDDLGMISSMGFGFNTAYGVTKFTADEHRYITKVATYVASGNSTVSLGIYKGMTDAIKSTNPLAVVSAQSCPYSGYYTFDLPEPVKLEVGQDFYVQAKYTTPESYYPLPVESFMDTYSDPEFSYKKSWISGNGKSWAQVGLGENTQVDLCIRALGVIDTVKNLTSGKDAEASSSDEGFGASNAFDGNISTPWTTALSDTQYIKVDLGASYNVKNVALYWAPAYAKEYELQSSTDDSTWSTVYTESDGNGEWDSLTVSSLARYFKVVATKSANSDGYSLYEFQAFAPVDTIAPKIGVEEYVTNEKVNSYQLENNYPNPFNPATKITYNLPKSSIVTLKVYDILGKEVITLVKETQSAGKHIVEFNGSNLPSGVYFYMLRTDDFTQVKKMVLLK